MNAQKGEPPSPDEYASWDDVTKAAWDNGWKNLAQCRRLATTYVEHMADMDRVNREAMEEDMDLHGVSFALLEDDGRLRRIDPTRLMACYAGDSHWEYHVPHPARPLISEEELKWGS